jgi:hypothetical protein
MGPRSKVVRRTWRIAGSVLAAVVWAAAPRASAAQTPSADVTRARELFVDASELRDHGDLRSALAKFEAAHALAVNPITTFELARTYAALGMLVQARDAYASIAGMPAQASETERATRARLDGAGAADDLRGRTPSLSVKVATPPDAWSDAWSVTLDDEPLPAAALAAPRAVNPGTHHLVATGPAGARAEQTITLREGEAREVELSAAPARAREPTADAPPRAEAPSRADTSPPAPEGHGTHFGLASYAGFGVGAAGFAVGTILAAATLSKASSIVTNCSDTSCEQSTKDAAHSARDLGTAAVVAYTVGFIGVGVGLADLILYRRDPSAASDRSIHPWIGVGAAGVRGSF